MNLNKLTKHERDRFDFAVIADWIPAGQRVLDLGCGDGALLRYLREAKGIDGYGVEIDPEVADGPQSLISEQVEMGVAVRMAAMSIIAGNEA